jgi:hypothetical protein
MRQLEFDHQSGPRPELYCGFTEGHMVMNGHFTEFY